MAELSREAAFAPFVAALPEGSADLRLSTRTTGIAAVFGDANAVAATFGVAPPQRPGVVLSEDMALVATGPSAWLAIGDAVVAEDGNGVAAIDQSSAYALLRIEGSAAWRLLAKGAFVDLDPAAFPPGSAAVTVIAHIGVILWKSAEDRFELAVFRSYAASFRHWLEAAAEAEGWRLGR